MPEITEAVDRPLRRDAERNRRRILDAARELFAQRGLAVTLNDVAHHAGVGVGTVYRRFPDKAALVESLFDEDVDAIVAMMERARRDFDPWHGLVRFMDEMFERQLANQSLKELLSESAASPARFARVRDLLLPMVAELVRRAQAAGDLRSDIEATDIAIAQLMVGAVMDASRDIAPGLWRRAFDLLLRGMATHPEAHAPLAGPPVSPGDVDAVLYRGHAAARPLPRPAGRGPSPTVED